MEINESCLGKEGKEGDLCKGNHRGEGQESRSNRISPKNWSSSLRLISKRGDNQEWSLSLGYWEGFPGGSDCKESACNAGDPGSISGQGKPLENGMATHSSILAGRIPRIEEPVRLQFMGSQRARHKIEWLILSQDTENLDNILKAMKSHWKTARQGVF